MSITFCGVPVGHDGKYICPLCGYSSANIENFAVGMCWNCVFTEDYVTKEEAVMSNDFEKRFNEGTEVRDALDVKPGDHVLIYREADVRSVTTSNTFTTKDNREVRTGGFDVNMRPLPAFKVRKIEKAGPDNWPPKAGQVWKDSAGVTYFVLSQPGDGVKVYTTDDRYTPTEDLKKKSGVHLVYSAAK